MFKKIIIIIIYYYHLILTLLQMKTKNLLRVGLLAPFSGEYKDMGQSIMLSLQLALDEINDDNIKNFSKRLRI